MIKNKSLLFCCLLTILIIMFSAQAAYASNFNISVNTATASSYLTGYEPSKAKDGVYDSSSNYWASNVAPTTSNPQWIVFDLGSSKYVGAINVLPDIGYGPQNYTIETSADNTNYTVQQTVSLTTDKNTFYSWSPYKTRYVRIKATPALTVHAGSGRFIFSHNCFHAEHQC